jgi:AcrR family transcriptional regulator
MTTKERTEQSSAEANQSRERILRAAFQLFSEKGLAGVSTLLIATRAKVSKRDLYAMFPSKEAMLAACIASRSERMRMPEGLPAPRTREMLATTLTAFGANFLIETLHPDVIGMYRLAIAEAIRSPEIARRLDEAREANGAVLSELFARAQSMGILPSGDVAQMVRKYFALTSDDLILSMLLGASAHPTRKQIEKRAAAVVNEFLVLHPPAAASA